MGSDDVRTDALHGPASIQVDANPPSPEGAVEEIEIKLAVVGSEPRRTLDAISSMSRIHVFQLGAPKRRLIRDRYCDTPTQELHVHGLRLRLREVNGELKFTLKARAKSDRGLFRRWELELPATRENWARVRKAIAEAGLTLQEGSTAADDAADWLGNAGLVVTQDRSTERRLRAVYDGSAPIGELALDWVVYRIGERRAEFCEIEIEPLVPTPDTACRIGEHLLAMFPFRLEPSTMGKYRRGIQLERSFQDP